MKYVRWMLYLIVALSLNGCATALITEGGFSTTKTVKSEPLTDQLIGVSEITPAKEPLPDEIPLIPVKGKINTYTMEFKGKVETITLRDVEADENHFELWQNGRNLYGTIFFTRDGQRKFIPHLYGENSASVFVVGQKYVYQFSGGDIAEITQRLDASALMFFDADNEKSLSRVRSFDMRHHHESKEAAYQYIDEKEKHRKSKDALLDATTPITIAYNKPWEELSSKEIDTLLSMDFRVPYGGDKFQLLTKGREIDVRIYDAKEFPIQVKTPFKQPTHVQWVSKNEFDGPNVSKMLLVPFSVALDIVTFPISVPAYFFIRGMGKHMKFP